MVRNANGANEACTGQGSDTVNDGYNGFMSFVVSQCHSDVMTHEQIHTSFIIRRGIIHTLRHKNKRNVNQLPYQ